MNNKMKLSCDISASLMKFDGLSHKVNIGTHWEWEHWKLNKRSGAKYLENTWDNDNLCTDEGVNHVLGVAFGGETQKTSWYLAIFNDDYTPLITNTYQAPGYTESVAYAGARPLWDKGAVSSKVITNSSNRAVFTMNATENIYGGALVSASTPGDSVSGEVLFCSAPFSNVKNTEDTDELKASVTITGSDV